jgi:hypothetical protein
MLGFALSCFWLAARLGETAEWVVITAGVVVAFGAVALTGYAAVAKPDLLRHERVVIIDRYLGWLTDRQHDEATRENALQAVTAIALQRGPKRSGGTMAPENHD